MLFSNRTFEVETRTKDLAPFRNEFRGLLENSGFDSKVVHDILLSVDEVLTNVIRHAYKEPNEKKAPSKIRIIFSDFKDRLVILIEDHGTCFDPCKMSPPELPPKKPGGLGIHLFRSLMDEVNYKPLHPKGNQLQLIKYKKGKESTKRQ